MYRVVIGLSGVHRVVRCTGQVCIVLLVRCVSGVLCKVVRCACYHHN